MKSVASPSRHEARTNKISKGSRHGETRAIGRRPLTDAAHLSGLPVPGVGRLRRRRGLPLRAGNVGPFVDGKQSALGVGLGGAILDQVPPPGRDQQAQEKRPAGGGLQGERV